MIGYHRILPIKIRLTSLFLLCLQIPQCKNFSWPNTERKDEIQAAKSQPIGLLSAPVYNPPQGLYNAAQAVTILGASGSTFCYATNGTNPDCDPATALCTNGTAYGAALAVGVTLTLKSLACQVGMNNSPVTSGTYTLDLAAPGSALSFVASPGDGEIALSWLNPADADFAGMRILRKTGTYPANASDGTIIYALTGTSTNDTGLVNGTQYYYAAYAFDQAGNFAPTAQATATPTALAVNAPVFNPTTGVFNTGQNIAASTSTAGALICYTTTGTTPACNATPSCTTGTTYTIPVVVGATTLLKAVACKAGGATSGVASATYTIDATPPVISAVQPASSALINSTQVSYTLSETCASGSITWSQTGGTFDSGSPHNQALTGSELLSGAHTGISLINSPTLTEGAIYGITFNCTDPAGNAAASVTSTSVTYNVNPPGNISSLRVIPGDTRTTLVWVNPPDADFAGVKILRKTGSYPVNSNDGTVVFNALGTSTLDTSLSNGTLYYYKAFSYDTATNYAGGVTATGTPFASCGGGVCRIFVTTLTFSGSLGNIAGADAKCNADAAKPNGSVYKAMLVDNATRRACSAASCGGATGVEQSLDWPIFPAKNYVRSDGTTAIGTASANALLPATLTNSIATGGGQNWTGLNADWTTATDTCNTWSDGTSGFQGARGTQNTTTSSAWANGTNPCVTSRGIYCVEQ